MKIKYVIVLSFLIGIIFCLSIIFGPKKIYFTLNGKEYKELNVGSIYKDEGFKAEYCNKYIKIFCKDLSDRVKVNKYEEKKDNKYFYKEHLISN